MIPPARRAAELVLLAGPMVALGVQRPAPYPHEPAGYVPIAENHFAHRPGWPPRAGGLRGRWWTYPVQNPNLTVGPVPDAPRSPPSVLATRFPKGLPGGTEPAFLGGWDLGDVGRQYSAIYLSMWIRIVGSDFENQAVGTKLGFFGYARDSTTAQNDGVLFLAGSGVQEVRSSFVLRFRQQNFTTRNLDQNVARAEVMTVGRWHHFEVVMEINNLGWANGVLRWWVDGKPIMDYQDMVYVVPGAIRGFQAFKWAPTWGGQGGWKTRDDLIQIDHVYISGRR